MFCRLQVENSTSKSEWVYSTYRQLRLAWKAFQLAQISLGGLWLAYILGLFDFKSNRQVFLTGNLQAATCKIYMP